MSVKQLTILGAGLMGGSLALAARQSAWAERIVAIDRKLPTGRESQSHSDFSKQAAQVSARASDPFDAWCDASDEQACESWLYQTDLAVLAMPVSGIGANLGQVLSVTQGFVTDMGSTKAWLIESIKNHKRRGQYIPGHPMAGHPVGGLDHANSELFQGRPWVICPDDSQPKGIATLQSLIDACGAHSVQMTAEEHDRAVARTSHIPQIVASALTLLADGRAKETAGPGFLSATRVAGGAEEMWRDIFATNHGAIAHGLKELTAYLSKIAQDLEAEHIDAEHLTSALALLEAARKLKLNPQ